MKRRISATAAAVLLCLSGVAQAVTMDTVPVVNAGNTADTRYVAAGRGSVGYAYNIGKYEVTAGQYCSFLNQKASTSDPYGLYNTDMMSTYGCKIQRANVAGGYSYSVAADWANRPVNYVSFWDACRFSNWLQNGQGIGDTESGAYTLSAVAVANNTVARNGGWKWAVTSENEWYKAAYYDPDKSGSAGYWDYATRSNVAPGNHVHTPDPGNQANYRIGGVPTIGDPYWMTNVGEFENSASAYGTFDQSGNAWEWNEGNAAARGMRGGSCGNDAISLSASNYTYFWDPATEGYVIGFRVVQAVPEPSSMLALACGLASLLGLSRRRT